jgi:hypothetical protein
MLRGKTAITPRGYMGTITHVATWGDVLVRAEHPTERADSKSNPEARVLSLVIARAQITPPADDLLRRTNLICAKWVMPVDATAFFGVEGRGEREEQRAGATGEPRRT